MTRNVKLYYFTKGVVAICIHLHDTHTSQRVCQETLDTKAPREKKFEKNATHRKFSI